MTRAVVLPIQQFIHIQGISSIFLLGAAVAALVWANSPWHEGYHRVWEMELTVSRIQLPVHAWINDALMAIFFFLVGVEIKHEIVHGELSDIRQATLPVVGALGGMIVPALLYAVLNRGTPAAHGWGIPMATDIAFSLGVLGLVKGVPTELKVFLLTLAIADDIGAIAVIALFYSDELHVRSLFVGLLLLIIIGLLLKLGVSRPILYFVLGAAFWVAILHSGIHATIAGVILGFMVPSSAPMSLADFDDMSPAMVQRYREARRAGDEKTAKNLLGAFEALVQSTESASERLTRQLNDWVSFLVLPLFALSNAGVTFSGGAWGELLTSRVTWGVLIGLVVGKPVGIFGFCWLAIRLKVAQLSSHVSWPQMGSVGVLAGIGFTVSIFISSLAFDDPVHLRDAKAAVLGASLIAGILGYLALRHELPAKDSAPAASVTVSG